MTLRNKILPEKRRKELKDMLENNKPLRFIEAHSGLSAIIGSTTNILTQNEKKEFDGLWISSLTNSAIRGLPDIELNNFEKRLESIDEIINVTAKPIIVDGDTGGEPIAFKYMCSKLEAMGVSAIVIEDKKFPKRNSLSDSAEQHLEDPYYFAEKIKCGLESLETNDFLIFARLESLIAKQGLDDALMRARVYLLAGASGLLIHSKQDTPLEIMQFLEGYDKICKEIGFRKPVICVPTTYHVITSEELFKRGINIVIYANHLLRASTVAIEKISENILKYDRTQEVEASCSSISSLFELVGFTDIEKKQNY